MPGSGMSILIEPDGILSFGIKAFFTTKTACDPIGVVIRSINIPRKNVYMPIQKHTEKVHVLESDLVPVIADAVVTSEKGVLIGVQVADCVPLLLFDRTKKVVGAVHAGWRGTAGGILKRTVKVFQDRFSSLSEDIFLAIGPSIRRCCYEVGDDVKTAVLRETGQGNYYYDEDNRCFLDLSDANRVQALSLEIPEKNIWRSGECTFCNPDRFYSYRHTKGTKGRQGGFIGMW
jgi:YfiH family protein